MLLIQVAVLVLMILLADGVVVVQIRVLVFLEVLMGLDVVQFNQHFYMVQTNVSYFLHLDKIENDIRLY